MRENLNLEASPIRIEDCEVRPHFSYLVNRAILIKFVMRLVNCLFDVLVNTPFRNKMGFLFNFN